MDIFGEIWAYIVEHPVWSTVVGSLTVTVIVASANLVRRGAKTLAKNSDDKNSSTGGDTYNVQTNHQSGGIAAGKIDELNVTVDEKSGTGFSSRIHPNTGHPGGFIEVQPIGGQLLNWRVGAPENMPFILRTGRPGAPENLNNSIPEYRTLSVAVEGVLHRIEGSDSPDFQLDRNRNVFMEFEGVIPTRIYVGIQRGNQLTGGITELQHT